MTAKHLFIFSLFFSSIGLSQVMWQFKKDTVLTWNYYDGDEFNGDKVDEKKWTYSPGGSHTIFNNFEQQYYTIGKNHLVKDGTLKLIARKETITGKISDWQKDTDSLILDKKFYTLNKKTFEYTSGQLETLKSFKNGFFECRLKIPNQNGYWPAFWLHGGYPNEEIDMMECKSERPHQIHIDTHCPNRCDDINYFFQKRSYGGWVKTNYNFTQEYTIIACDWDENKVKFYINGECIGISNVKFTLEKFLTINLAIPSNNGPFHPGPKKNENTEAVYEIDYVRIWNKENTIKSKTNPQQTIDINTNIQMSNTLANESKTKTKNKLVYDSKSSHSNDEIFISYLNNKDFIQIITLGIFKEEKPKYLIKSTGNNEIVKGSLEKQIINISKNTLEKGEYFLTITYKNKLVQKLFSID
ncbi:MAG: glycoside hydrolase family 16 protein [Bacteroidota bacterium]|nr:glycoside hydrolase family 16 protein [Bacteroidota bacterium]